MERKWTKMAVSLVVIGAVMIVGAVGLAIGRLMPAYTEMHDWNEMSKDTVRKSSTIKGDSPDSIVRQYDEADRELVIAGSSIRQLEDRIRSTYIYIALLSVVGFILLLVGFFHPSRTAYSQ